MTGRSAQRPGRGRRVGWATRGLVWLALGLGGAALAAPTTEVAVAPIPSSAQVPPPIAERFDGVLRARVAQAQTVVDPAKTAAAVEASTFEVGCDTEACAQTLGAALNVRFVLTARVVNNDEIYTVSLALLDRLTQKRIEARGMCELCAVDEVDATLSTAVGSLTAALKAPAPGLAVEVTLGADTDIAHLAAEAERKEAERKEAEAAKATMSEAKAAESKKLLAEVQAKLNAQAEADFEAIRRMVEAPSDTNRPVLEAFVQKYGEASVTIGDVPYALEVPQVARVREALTGKPEAPAAEAPTAEAAKPAAEDPDALVWVAIEGGSFTMGSKRGGFDEQPVREITVPGFRLARSAVTVAQYRRCVEAGACTPPATQDGCNWTASGREKHPINCVDWAQAKAFATWAGARLPTEAEREFAARSGGRKQEFPWGNADPTAKRAVISSWDRDHTDPVCTRPAGNSAQGVCDLAGNVWEWVADWYGGYADAPTDGSARTRPTDLRGIRGGSWNDSGADLRASMRDGRDPVDRETDLGFRVAKDAEPPKATGESPASPAP